MPWALADEILLNYRVFQIDMPCRLGVLLWDSRGTFKVFAVAPIEKSEMETIKYAACLVVGPRDPKVCQPVAEALFAVGVAKARLVAQVDRAEGVIARADAEGGAPIVVTWAAERPSAALVAELLQCDPLPGRPYVLIAPDDVTAAMMFDDLEARVPNSAERVLVLSHADLGSATTRALLQMHLSRACAAYLGRPRRARGVLPTSVTEMPMGERVIDNIDRRNMQRGLFHVKALRMPSF